MNRSRAAILKQAADAVSGGERTADRSAFQTCEYQNSPSPRRSRAVCASDRRLHAGTVLRLGLGQGSHFGADNFASKISASTPSKMQQCVCAPWKLTPSPKWLVVRPPRFGHVVPSLKGAQELLSVYAVSPDLLRTMQKKNIYNTPRNTHARTFWLVF